MVVTAFISRVSIDSWRPTRPSSTVHTRAPAEHGISWAGSYKASQDVSADLYAIDRVYPLAVDLHLLNRDEVARVGADIRANRCDWAVHRSRPGSKG